MKRTLWWRLVGIIALTLFFVLVALIPWSQLDDGFQGTDMLDVFRPGIDLNGGTRLIYQVDTSSWAGGRGKSPAQSMIEALKKRVDPEGTKNIIWRAIGEDRIEIVIPRATASASRQRDEYDKARNDLFDRNISRRELQAALAATTPEERRAELLKLGRGVPGREEMLGAIADSWEAIKQAETPSTSQPDGINVALITATATYEDLVTKLLATNIQRFDVDRVLKMSAQLRVKKDEAGKTPVDLLLAKYPEFDAQIKATISAYDQWKEQKESLDDPDDLKRLLKGTGVLEFHLAAEPGVDNISQTQVKSYIEALTERNELLLENGRYKWFPVSDPDVAKGGRVVVAEVTGQPYVLLHMSDDKSMVHPHPDQKQKDWKFQSAFSDRDNRNLPAVGFRFDDEGGNRFGRLTGQHVGRILASVLDGSVISAPNIQSMIQTRGIITGNFSAEEAAELAQKLQAGALPGSLSKEPISESEVSPSLGKEHRDAGLRAAVIGLAAVALFMLVYYLAPLGLAAVIALTLNLIYIVACMSMLNATWTLPGIAGLILTVGMAVDANVLIYERIREEQERGAPLRVAVKNGYGKALSTILDANVTTLITTIILYFVGTTEIKGFAVVLGIGVVSSVFTALVVTRVVIGLGVEYGWIKNRMKMLKLIGRPSVGWMKKRFWFWGLSAFLLVFGFSEFFGHSARDLYDVEMIGGSRVQVTLTPPPGVEVTGPKLEKLLQKHPELLSDPNDKNSGKLADARAHRVIQAGTEDPSHLRFEITTTRAPLGQEKNDVGDLVITALSTPGRYEEAGLGDKSLLPEKAVLNFAREDSMKQWSEEAGPSELPDNAFAITEATVTGRGIEMVDLRNHVGGVGIVFENITPAVTLDDIRARISAKLTTPQYETLPQTEWEVYGIQRTGEADGAPRYSRVLLAAGVGERTPYDTSPGGDNTGWQKEFAFPEVRMAISALSEAEVIDSMSDFSPSVAQDVKLQALTAIILAMVAIVIYVWVRFGNWLFGLGAILPLVHDVAVVIGLIAISKSLVGWVPGLADALMIQDFRFDLTVVAAILTIIGYSLNDTIVVFDRIRENRGRLKYVTGKIIDDSINQNISRTLLTSLTTFIAVFIMYVLGGQGIHAFTFALLVGLVFGTYSSIAVASPILLGWRTAILRRAVKQEVADK